MEKIALITGASKGIGKELAEVFAQNGYSLLLIARNLDELEQLQIDLKNKYQCTSKILSIDLANAETINIIMDTFKDEMSNVEVLVNNAGFGFAKKYTDIPIEDVSGMVAVNIDALTKFTYRVLPHMVAKKSGKILNVSSLAGFLPGPYMAVYYATKTYILSFSQSLHEEYKRDGIIVSALCPGVTQTPFLQRAGLDKTYLLSGLLPIMTAKKVASIAYRGLMMNQRVIVTGFMNKITVFISWLIPSFISAKITAVLQKPKIT